MQIIPNFVSIIDISMNEKLVGMTILANNVTGKVTTMTYNTIFSVV